jgi:type IV pilus assembly protein PilV
MKVRSRREAGVSLLEVMVAILIMSFGLLALGGLAAAAQQYVKMAQYQSIGMALASDLGERMRGNVQAFEKGSYARTAAYSTAAANAPPCKIETACTADEMAAINMAQWIGELQQRLPGGDAYVQRDAVNPLATDVWLLWMDPDAQSGKVGLGVGATGDCPAAAVAGIKGDAPRPRCMYYRISI